MTAAPDPHSSTFWALAKNFSLGRKKHTSAGSEMSSETYGEKLSSNKKDVMSYRQFFAKRWQAFIRENYESPTHVAFVFKVDPKTASLWWEGCNAPQGWVVARAMTDPTTASQASRHLTCEKFAAE